jgi:hypothetical protein
MENIKEEFNNCLEIDKAFEIFCREHSYKYVYKCSWYESKRHKKSHIDMYYGDAEDVKWIFDTDEWFNDLVKIEYIRVCNKSNEYISASLNSMLCNAKPDNKDLNKQIIKEFI